MNMEDVQQILKAHDEMLDAMTEEELVQYYRKYGITINPKKEEILDSISEEERQQYLEAFGISKPNNTETPGKIK